MSNPNSVIINKHTKDNVNKLLDSWEGKKSEEKKLKEILGECKAEELLKNMESKKRKNKLG
jgi:hypothetical protein